MVNEASNLPPTLYWRCPSVSAGGRLSIGACSVGAAQICLEISLKYVKARAIWSSWFTIHFLIGVPGKAAVRENHRGAASHAVQTGGHGREDHLRATGLEVRTQSRSNTAFHHGLVLVRSDKQRYCWTKVTLLPPPSAPSLRRSPPTSVRRMISNVK